MNIIVVEIILECSQSIGEVVKNLPANAGDMSFIPGLGRFSGEGNDNLPGSSPGGVRGFEGEMASTIRKQQLI